ncbi:MAG: tRNA (N(6)-L-threonylcarbamoyladenosine(37)-C(2))-methylthiotransferase MtaB [Eubacteriales bacterium]
MSEIFSNQNQNTSLPDEKTYTISFQTLGCKVNRYETDAVRQAFEEQGFQVISDSEPVDVFVINTCTVTAEADRKSRQMIRRARRNNPKAVIVAMGCQIELLKSASEADISIGTKNRISVVERVLERIGKTSLPISGMSGQANGYEENVFEKNTNKYNGNQENQFQEFGPVLSQEETRAYIKIEDGCDSFCSYCIIPFARGRVVSRTSIDVIKEAKELGRRGFHEIVLTGIHICSFGKDRGEDIKALEQLLFELDEIPSIHRIRLGSLEPNSMTEYFIQSISRLKKLCPHFHISLQSGSDTVLARMNRKYDTAAYRSVISHLRQYFADFSVTTDIIVAFPGETIFEHQESLEFCREMGFSRIHVFPFSARNGTKAAGMLPKVSSDTAARRRDDFLYLSRELADEHCASMVGKQVEVLVETRDGDGCCTGYTKQYVRVNIIDVQEYTQGMEVSVHIESCKDGELFGRIAVKSKT